MEYQSSPQPHEKNVSQTIAQITTELKRPLKTWHMEIKYKIMLFNMIIKVD